MVTELGCIRYEVWRRAFQRTQDSSNKASSVHAHQPAEENLLALVRPRVTVESLIIIDTKWKREERASRWDVAHSTTQKANGKTTGAFPSQKHQIDHHCRAILRGS